jgi:hypothetical protein
VRSNPQFLFLRRFSETVFFEDFGSRVLRGAECSYPVIAVHNTQAIGKLHRNRGLAALFY